MPAGFETAATARHTRAPKPLRHKESEPRPRPGRTPKAGVAGSNPAGGTKPFPQVRGHSQPSCPLSDSDDSRCWVPKGTVHPVQRRAVSVRAHQVAVGVQRQLRGRVTQPRRQRLDVDPGSDPEACRRVPQVVRTPPQAGLGPVHRAPPVLRRQVSAFRGREQQVIGFSPIGPPLHDRTDQVGERNHPRPAALRRRALDHGTGQAGLRDRPLDDEAVVSRGKFRELLVAGQGGGHGQASALPVVADHVRDETTSSPWQAHAA